MTAGQHVETDRLILRPFLPEDQPAYAAIRAKPQVIKFLAGGTARAPAASDVAREVIQSFIAQWAGPPGYGPWAIIERATNALLGHGGLRLLPDLENQTELLYALDNTAWHKGYATEMGQAALRFGFNTLGLNAIIALALPENTASRRVMERVNLRQVPGSHQAFGHSVVKYRLTRSEWEGSQ